MLPSLPPIVSPRALVLLLCLLVHGCLAVPQEALAPWPKPPEGSAELEHAGLWRVRFENDTLLFTDGNYSSGLQVGYLTQAVEHMRPSSFSARLADALEALPGMAAPAQRHYVSYSVGQLIFTPENIKARDPGPDALPYTGLLYFDTGVFARSEDVLSAYHLLLGVTGEPSLAEESQKTLHDLLDQGRPRGWTHQSRDEPIVNLGFERHWRRARGVLESELEWDLTTNLGGALGNFFTGLNAGLRLRLGQRLPEELGSTSINTGFESSSIPLLRPGARPNWQAFLGLESYAVGRYLPVDGNLLQKSRSTPAEDLVLSASAGLSYTWGRLAIGLGYQVISDIYQQQGETTQVGSLSLDFFP